MTELIQGGGAIVKLASGRFVYVEKHARDASATNSPDIPMLIIPGMSLTTRSWQPTLPLLTRYTRIVYDVQGHGRTPNPGVPITSEMLVQDILDILTYFGYDSTYIIAHSAASYTAANFTQLYPKKVKKIIFVTPSTIPVPDYFQSWPNTVRTADLFNDYYQNWLGPKGKADTTVMQLLKDETDIHEHRKEELAQFYEANALKYKHTTLHSWDAWIVIGSDDSIILPETCLAMCDCMKAKPVIVDGGHYLPFENPVGLADALLSVLNGTAH